MPSLLLILHIASGFTALTSGLVAALTKKGGKTHRTAGKIFYTAMYVVVVASTILSIQKSNWFLFSIGIFAFYLTYSGVRALQMKNITVKNLRWYDWAAAITACLCGAGMIVFATWNMIQKGQVDLNLVLIVFGYGNLSMGANDLRLFKNKVYMKGNSWLKKHIIRMGGAFISSITAFCVVNGGRVPNLGHELWFSLMLWLGPSVIGTILITFTIRKYIVRKKWMNA